MDHVILYCLVNNNEIMAPQYSTEFARGTLTTSLFENME